MESPLPRTTTGIPGLDRHLRGGFFTESQILVSGGIGTGKTVFGLQFLLAGTAAGTRGMYVTVGPATGAMKFAHGALLQRFYAAGKRVLTHRSADDPSFWETLPDAVARNRITRLVIDGLGMTEREHLQHISPVLDALRSTGVTTVLLHTASSDNTVPDSYAERLAAACDTVLSLAMTQTAGGLERSLRVTRIRGSGFTERPLACVLNAKGMSVPAASARKKSMRDEVLLLHPYDLFMPQWSAWYERLAGRLRRSHPDVTFTVRAERQGTLERMLAEDRNGVGLVLLPARRMGLHVRNDDLADISGLVSPGRAAAYLPRALDAGRFRNTLFGVPAVFDMKQVFYRRDLLDKYGFGPPADWDELAAQARHVIARENDPSLEGLVLPAPNLQICLVELFLEYLWHAGGDLYDDRGAIGLDSGPGRRAVAFLRDLADTGIVRTAGFPVIFQNSIRTFHAGRAVFLYHTSELWYCRNETIPRLPASTGACIMGTGNSGPSCLLEGACLAVPARTRFPRIAQDAMRAAADPSWNYRERKRAGFTMALTPFKKFYDGPDKPGRVPGLTDAAARGCYPAERPPLGEASPSMERELAALMAGGRGTERTLSRLYEQFRLFRGRDKYRQSVRRAVSFMESHYTLPVTLHDVAAQVHMSPRHLNRVFKLHTGSTCIDYLLGIRMEAAQQHLTRTAHPVSEVAVRCGYQDQNYFSAQFSKRVGMSPTKYRQLYRI